MTKIRAAIYASVIINIVILQADPALAQRGRGRGRGHNQEYSDSRAYQSNWRNYDYNRFEPGQGRYDAARYYRSDKKRYKAKHLGRNDRIYRGSDNRYYCRRDDGTTGLIVGGMAGGVLGHIIAPGGSKTLGTIIGAGAGALIGRQVDRGDIVCE